MYPHLDHFENFSSGIAQVVKYYFKHLPEFGIEMVVQSATSYDLEAGHAGARPGADVYHSHGMLWTAEFKLGDNSWEDNVTLVESARSAKEITVPSNWVAEPFRRDMRIDPHVIWHGVDWDSWQHNVKNEGYVLWAKNRKTDGLDPGAINDIAKAFPNVQFYTTFGGHNIPNNVKVFQGALPHDEMKLAIQGAAVVLMTDRETWGILAAEAMAAGVPVLSVDAGATPDFMEHGIAGYCYQQGNLEDALVGLAYCLEHGEMLGKNGRELARSLTWESACEKVAGVYRLAMEEEEPTVSIVIPCYNCGSTLEEAIESAVNQDYQGLTDIVVVDDGSTDNSVRVIAETWTGRDRRVRYLRQQNSGVAIARNAGARYTDTKYICFVDADDKIEPGFISALVEPMERDRGLGITYTGVKVHFPNGHELLPWDWPENIKGTGQEKHNRMWPREWMFNLQVAAHNQIPTCCLIRRKAFDRVGGYRARYCPDGAGSEDAEMFLRLGAYGWAAKYVPPQRDTCWIHAHGMGNVSGNKEYSEPDWTVWHPWTRDGGHPLASYATPDRISHPVRSYEKPVVSVIIPVGPGHEENVIDALDSLEAQTMRYWEAIVVFDGSHPKLPGGSLRPREKGSDSYYRDPEAVKRFRDAYPYIKALTISGGLGAGYARNFGVTYATAPFVAFLDADDYYSPTFLEAALEVFDYHASVIYSDFVSKMTVKQHEKYGGKIVKEFKKSGEVMVDDSFDDFDRGLAMIKPMGDRPYIWSGVTVLLPKLWHEEIGGFDEEMETWEDCDYLLRLAWKGYNFFKIPEPLWMYNFSSGHRREKHIGKEREIVEYLAKKWEDSVKWDAIVEMETARS